MGMFDWFPFGNKNSVEVAQNLEVALNKEQKTFDEAKQNLEVAQKTFDEAKQNLEVAQKTFDEAKEQKNPVATTEIRGATTVATTTTTTGGKSRRHKNKPHKKTRRPKY